MSKKLTPKQRKQIRVEGESLTQIKKILDKIPTREEWGDLGVDLEIEYAYKLYGGKSAVEVMHHFVRSPIERAHELRWVTFRVFRYYVQCFVNFLISPDSEGESDAASCFLGLVRDRMKKEPQSAAIIYSQLKEAIEFVSSRQDFYDADTNIYGSFPDLQKEIEKLGVA